MNTKKIRMLLDILMTLISIILMGGAYLFPSDIVHEILGMTLFILWAVHITLNRRWYKGMFRGKYNSRRIIQTIINCGLLVCVLFLMISGIILSNHIFTFLKIESGLGFARTAHLLSSHWYFLFMSLHIGLHVAMIMASFHNRHAELDSASTSNSGKRSRIKFGMTARDSGMVVIRVRLILISLYGLYAFITRGIWRYLILQQQFFFLDLERGYLLFAIDYIAIIVFFATVIHYLSKLLQKGNEK